MKVLLPSKGIYGQKVVNMRIPTFGDLHEIQTFNNDDLLRKYEFVRMLTDAKLDKITYDDFEYLFAIAAFSVVFNCAKFNIKCDCSIETFVKNVELTSLDIITLDISRKNNPFTKRIDGVKYTFSILTAKQVYDSYIWAQYEENEEFSFSDAKVASIMGISFDDISKVKSLPISIYAGALLFQTIYYHGLEREITAVCPNCGKEHKFNFALSSKVLSFDIPKMIDRFVSISDRLSFIDFLSMSILDFNSFVESVNRRV